MGRFLPFWCMILLVIFSFPYLLGRTESLKLILPIGGQQLGLQLKQVFHANGDEVGWYEIQVRTRCSQGCYWLLLKVQFKLHKPLFVPASVANMITSILDLLLQVFSGLKVILPIKNRVELVIRIQEVLDVNQNHLCYKIKIGSRSIQGYSFLFEARLR